MIELAELTFRIRFFSPRRAYWYPKRNETGQEWMVLASRRSRRICLEYSLVEKRKEKWQFKT